MKKKENRYIVIAYTSYRTLTVWHSWLYYRHALWDYADLKKQYPQLDIRLVKQILPTIYVYEPQEADIRDDNQI